MAKCLQISWTTKICEVIYIVGLLNFHSWNFFQFLQFEINIFIVCTVEIFMRRGKPKLKAWD